MSSLELGQALIRTSAPSCAGRGSDRPFKKAFSAMLQEVAGQKGIDPDTREFWFGDEARVGQKNKITRRWAKLGSRPAAPHDQRTASTYSSGAICPREGKAAGLVLPWCNMPAVNLHLAESPHMSSQAVTRCRRLTRRAGISNATSRCLWTSQSFRCLRNVPS